jgi:hypothetical protein
LSNVSLQFHEYSGENGTVLHVYFRGNDADVAWKGNAEQEGSAETKPLGFY